jgi:tetratricopeptide (TPR) repeat protein
MAQCKQAMTDYEEALGIYKFKVMAAIDAEWEQEKNGNSTAAAAASTPPQQRKMLMGMSECLYYLGKYKLAIEIGEAAIEMNRYFPQVHKFVALSQKDSGDLEAAIRTMGRAVCYETPWDEANKQIVLELYRELQQSANAAGE